MTCAEVERILPEVLEDAPVNGFQSAFDIHLRSCPECSALVSDLKTISSAARELSNSNSEEPSPRVWVRIAAELRAEGLIREPGSKAVRPGRASTARSGAWWLVPVAAALISAGAYVVSHRSATQVADRQPSAPSGTGQSSHGVSVSSEPSSQAVAVKISHQPANNSKQTAHITESESSADDQQFLTEVSTRAPSMRVTYQSQLQAVNSEIREVQAYLDKHPQDLDARQQLMDAYQQKALLYQIALDRIQ
jgi:hypothetical protein